MQPRTAESPERESTAEGEPARTVTIGGDRRLAYVEYGHADGTPVVFLHGTPGSRCLARSFDDDAEAAGVRLLAPDRPGYGDSSPWPDRSPGDAGAFLTALLDDAGVDTAGVIAFSGGGPHALAAAASHPDRFGRVDLVAGAVPPQISQDTPAIQRLLSGMATRTPRLLGGLFRGQAWLAARLDPSFVLAQYTTGDPDGVPDWAAETVREDFVRAFANHRRGAVTELRNAATESGIDPAEIDADVTLWHGENDTNVPITDARRLAETLPAAELRAVEADHLGTLLRATPEVLAAHGD